MSKKAQFVIWAVIVIAAIILIAFSIYKAVERNTTGNIHPVVAIEFENYGTVSFELYPEYAPNTVANFIKLAQSEYYNDKVLYGKDNVCLYFGRNSEGEIDDPTTDTIGYPVASPYSYSIDGEFIANGFNDNTLRHEKGVITLIRNNYTEYFSSLYEESYNSGNAQIGIMMSDDASNLDGVYAGFGKVVEGMDVLEKIYNEVAVESDASKDETGIKKFAEFPKVTAVTIDTHGIDYGMPEIHEMFDYTEFINQYISAQNY